MVILSTAYFPPISWFLCLIKDFTLQEVESYCVVLEAKENYQKQSYRNRCKIMSSMGEEVLNIPIVSGNSKLITDIEIEYTTAWIQKTKRCLTTAYMNSPFFEYYMDDIFAILDSRPKTLWQLNLDLIKYITKKIGLNIKFEFTEDYVSDYGADDYRYLSNAKIKIAEEDIIKKKPYFQVFAQKYGFISNLSILDLLFNEGPYSLEYLYNLKLICNT